MGLDQVGTMEHFRVRVHGAAARHYDAAWIFAALALLISTSGIAAVMMLSVTQRTRELGIRMALGAERRAIVAMVVRQGLCLRLIGIGVGICGAMALTRLLSTLLYATSPTDV